MGSRVRPDSAPEVGLCTLDQRGRRHSLTSEHEVGSRECREPGRHVVALWLTSRRGRGRRGVGRDRQGAGPLAAVRRDHLMHLEEDGARAADERLVSV